MKTTKHTPGPWPAPVAGTDHGWATMTIEQVDLHVVVTAPHATELRDGTFDNPSAVYEMEANARLIAKAPELLTALVDTLDALHNETHGQDDTPWIQSVKDRARTIIAQATGEK